MPRKSRVAGMTPEERAKECNTEHWEVALRHIKEAIAATYEDAARVVDTRADVWRSLGGQSAMSLQEECEDIAAAIRAMKYVSWLLCINVSPMPLWLSRNVMLCGDQFLV